MSCLTDSPTMSICSWQYNKNMISSKISVAKNHIEICTVNLFRHYFWKQQKELRSVMLKHVILSPHHTSLVQPPPASLVLLPEFASLITILFVVEIPREITFHSCEMYLPTLMISKISESDRHTHTHTHTHTQGTLNCIWLPTFWSNFFHVVKHKKQSTS
jgi:hypothetical protein